MWILVNIGCIECGVSSNIVGVFSNKEHAEQLCKTLDKKANWREGGQNSFEIFDMPPVDEVHVEYHDYLKG